MAVVWLTCDAPPPMGPHKMEAESRAGCQTTATPHSLVRHDGFVQIVGASRWHWPASLLSPRSSELVRLWHRWRGDLISTTTRRNPCEIGRCSASHFHKQTVELLTITLGSALQKSNPPWSGGEYNSWGGLPPRRMQIDNAARTTEARERALSNKECSATSTQWRYVILQLWPDPTSLPTHN